MKIRNFTLSAQAKEQLIRLKIKTGIEHWNILCRWAFCVSLQEPTPPTPIDIPADSNVELAWHVFGGEHSDLYLGLLSERMLSEGLELSDREAQRQFRLHLHRGIAYLATPGQVQSIRDLVLFGDTAETALSG